MTACYTWASASVYNLNPTVKVDYSDDTGTYEYNKNLITSTTYKDVETENNCSDTNC